MSATPPGKESAESPGGTDRVGYPNRRSVIYACIALLLGMLALLLALVSTPSPRSGPSLPLAVAYIAAAVTSMLACIRATFSVIRDANRGVPAEICLVAGLILLVAYPLSFIACFRLVVSVMD